MNVLGTAVAWAAIIASVASVVTVIVGYRNATRARHEEHVKDIQAAYERGRASVLHEVTELHERLEQVRKDRDYWRDMIVRRVTEK